MQQQGNSIKFEHN